MTQLDSLNVYQRYFVEEFVEDYRERHLSRREMLRRVLYVTGSVPLAASVLTTLGCGNSSRDSAPDKAATTARAAPTSPSGGATGSLPGTPPPASGAGVTVDPNDPAIEAREVRFRGSGANPASEVIAYLVKPRGAGPFSALIVIHENRGLVEHIKDVTRRYAKEGFVGLAVDLVSRGGGSGADQAQNTGFLSRGASTADFVSDLQAGVDYLKSQTFVNAKALGVTGFCFGGGYTWELAVSSPDIRAAVPYYGTAQNVMDRLGQTGAAILAIYGGNDRGITGQAPQVEERLKAAGKTIEVKVYDGANHAFFNDTGASYNADAAKDAWAQTLSWFRRYLAA